VTAIGPDDPHLAVGDRFVAYDTQDDPTVYIRATVTSIEPAATVDYQRVYFEIHGERAEVFADISFPAGSYEISPGLTLSSPGEVKFEENLAWVDSVPEWDDA
jgi:hypothetical protein